MTPPRASQAEALHRLRSVLGGQPPSSLAQLSQADLTDLTQAIEDAKRSHSDALDAALNDAFGQVPRLLRGAVKRVVLR